MNLEDFESEISFFNLACGNKPITTEDTLYTTCKAALQQGKIILEEVKEYIKAAEEGDEEELKDGIIDILYTSLRLVSLFEQRYDIEAGMEVVAENNNLKWTESFLIAQHWLQGMPESIKVNKSVISDGAVYYCLKDENGKVRKWQGFPKVDLSVMDKVKV